MKKLLALLLGLALLSGQARPAYAEEGTALTIDCAEQDAIQIDQLPQEKEEAWNDYCRTLLADEQMQSETADCAMSSGHPNGVELYNLSNLPIQLQAGEYDEEYDRNTVTAEYGMKLDELQQYGGFEHRTLIHTDCGHNYEDYSRDPIPVMRDSAAWLTDGERDSEDVNSFPPDYMDQFVREPIPEYLLWDLGTRASLRETGSFY